MIVKKSNINGKDTSTKITQSGGKFRGDEKIVLPIKTDLSKINS